MIILTFFLQQNYYLFCQILVMEKQQNNVLSANEMTNKYDISPFLDSTRVKG